MRARTVNDIGTYGQAVVTPRYWKVKQYWPQFGSQIRIYLLDEHGQATVSGHGMLAEGEALEELPTLAEAIAEHMRPASAEANSNTKRFVEKRRREEPERGEDPPAPMDPATRRFFSDGGEMDYDAWRHARRRL